MGVSVVTPPATIATLEATKLYLRVDHTDDDGTISVLIAAAQERIDGPSGTLNRSIGVQRLRLTTEAICDGSIDLPYGPIVGDIVVTYLDSSGDEQTIDDENYRVVDGKLWLTSGYTFPGTYSAPDAIRIEYDAGYETVPDGLRLAIMVHVAMNYDPSSAETLQPLYEALIKHYYVPYV